MQVETRGFECSALDEYDIIHLHTYILLDFSIFVIICNQHARTHANCCTVLKSTLEAPVLSVLTHFYRAHAKLPPVRRAGEAPVEYGIHCSLFTNRSEGICAPTLECWNAKKQRGKGNEEGLTTYGCFVFLNLTLGRW